MIRLYLLILCCFFYSNDVYAYLGPGIGGGVIAATIGVVIATLAALIGLVWFPIKRLLKKRKGKKEQQQNKVD
tara:strand:- start:1293 stop:1511 length:219 start_codon:yes stop_codon:yes gene_type:complete